MTAELMSRAFPLDDIRIQGGGDGRTVEAYAAVFNTPTPIHDRQGQYLEQIDPAAFNRTIQHRGTNIPVIFNHGLTLQGTPSDRGTVPIGKPIEIRADARGVLTVARYAATPLADEVLDGIRSGVINAQSFSGRFLRSDPTPPRGGFAAGVDGELTLVTRTEVELREFGPAVFAAYPDAAIVGVRGACDPDAACPACGPEVSGGTQAQPGPSRSGTSDPELAPSAPDPLPHSAQLSRSFAVRQTLRKLKGRA